MKNNKTKLLYSVLSLLLCLSMLLGSTFAWFTDSVQSGINVIAAGNLDVALYHSNAAVQNEPVGEATELFMDLNGKDILWEPGVVSYENLRIANEGDLALTYQLAIATANENYIVDGNNQYGLSQILKVGFVEGGITATDRAGVVASVPAANWTTLASFVKDGSLLPAGAGESEKTWGVVVYWEPGDNDNRWNLNNGKTLNQGEVLSIDLGVQLIATQEVNELDGFDNKYDENAKAEFFPGFQGGSAGAAVTADDQGVTTAEVAMDGGDVSAVIPAGVQVAEGTTSMALSVTLKDSSEANVQLGESEEKRALDVHIEGVAQGNTVPMLITLEHYLSTGINTGALRLYHVENGTPVAMTQVANPINHNEFSYDPLTGDVTLALASFSEVAVIANNDNTWNGDAEAWTGSGTEADPYLIATAGHMAHFRNLVDGGNTFAGKYVKLQNNITLSKVNFDPIGWGYANKDWNAGKVEGKVFQGTFDGNNKIIFDLYQSGWDLKNINGEAYTYTNCGFGLFAGAANATFKNLTIYGADIRVECVETGILVGLSQGSCKYEGIKIVMSKVANYQRPTGGLIGEVSPLNDGGKTEITNVVIGADVVVGSLWGDFDAPCGGVIGARWDDTNTTEVYMTNVKVHCQMDVYSDVTSAYQWYAYRRAGMLIGNTEQVDPNNQHLAYADFLKCENVEVCYGDWANYTYYQFTNQDNDWCNNYPWVRAEIGENCSAFSNPRYGQPVVDGVQITSQALAEKNKTGYVEIPFGQLYGGGQGVYGQPDHPTGGVDVVDCRYTITYINDGEILSVKYVTDNSVAVLTENAPAQHLVQLWAQEDSEKKDWEFSGWMNAGSTKLDRIDAGTTKDIVLYPCFKDRYTVTYVDNQGNILHWETITAGTSKTEVIPAVPVIEGGYTGVWSITDFSEIDKDVTVYPVYNADDGIVKLEPVDVEPKDGIIDYYKVTSVEESDANINIVIPSKFNGKDVTEISGNAFAEFDNITTIKIPVSITTIGADAFANKETSGILSTLKYEQITILYEGTYNKWQEIRKDDNWDRYVGQGSKIYFLADGTYIEETARNGTWSATDRVWSNPKTGTYTG